MKVLKTSFFKKWEQNIIFQIIQFEHSCLKRYRHFMRYCWTRSCLPSSLTIEILVLTKKKVKNMSPRLEKIKSPLYLNDKKLRIICVDENL